MALGHLAGILCGVIVVSNGMVAKKEERERTANQGYRNDDVMSGMLVPDLN